MLVDEDNDFIKQLPLQLQGSYTKQKSDTIKKIKEESAKNFSDYFRRKDKGIKEDKYHKEVLNSCIFPFVQDGGLPNNLDYVYLRSSPLSELKVKNVDFLIASQSKGIAIFGEAKGTIENPNLVISQYRERMRVINDNLDKVKEYVPNLKKIEYVLGVPSMDAVNTIKSIIRSKIDLILWETGGIGEQQLSLVVPPNVDYKLKKSVMHEDQILNKSLSKLTTSAEYKTFFHESHPVSKIELLSGLDKNENNSFTYDKVKKIVSEELHNTSENEVEQITQNIIKLAIDINFVNCKDDGNYKIQSIHKHPKSRYEELKNKWIEYRHQQDEITSIDAAILKIQAQFIDKKKNIPSIDDYLN